MTIKGTPHKCGKCGKSFKRKTKWHDFCTRKCQMDYWVISKAKEIEAEAKNA